GLAEDDARDVVQNVFVNLVKALPAFERDPARGRFRTWLWQVAMNALADWHRDRGRQPAQVATLPEPQSTAAQDLGDEWRAAHRRRVLDFVLGLVRQRAQPRTWACFERHLLAGETAAAVAAELGITRNAVYVNASRLFAEVRERCAEYEEELNDASE